MKTANALAKWLGLAGGSLAIVCWIGFSFYEVIFGLFLKNPDLLFYSDLPEGILIAAIATLVPGLLALAGAFMSLKEPGLGGGLLLFLGIPGTGLYLSLLLIGGSKEFGEALVFSLLLLLSALLVLVSGLISESLYYFTG